MEEKLSELKRRLAEINDLNAASLVLSWDQSTNMPPGGELARARQLSTLRRLAHQRSSDPQLGQLLDALQPYANGLPDDADDACLIQVARRDYERAICIPADFVARLSQHRAESYSAWAAARPENDFATVQPFLEKTLHLSRQLANFSPGYQHVADPLIDRSDEGMTVAVLRPLFAELHQQLVPLAQAIAGAAPIDDALLHQHYPADAQWGFGLEVARRLGYDFQRGREDQSPHPYTTRFSIGDVRITTRIDEHDLGEALFGTIHEVGHALYEQGIAPRLEATPLAQGTSSGVHESQSRLWENIVGRSWGFWQFFYPHLQAAFPRQLGAVSLDAFYRAINKVQPGLIRTSADEVTYNLHVIIRFEMELELLEGHLAVRDLPEAWRARYQADLGITPPDDRSGVMQDVHWFSGVIGGAFQGYSLGNILSVQFYEAAVRAQPQIPAEVERGDFGTLLGWLQENIYRHGRKFTAAQLVERVVGGPMRIEPYMRYLRAKFGELYAIQ
ncbi:MAG: carboxypeptidase M32 [Anaerolineae bacterium]|nr:carboxypeptidase M32 [Anaerolineae bacterium]